MRIVQTRGGAFESEHPVSAVWVDATGVTLDTVGPPVTTSWRSAAKPFQLAVSLSFLDAAGLAPEDIAVGAASHTAEPAHVARVTALMERFGVGLADLYCGAHWPGDPDAAHALAAAGRTATALHNNCSGKHTYMAAACRAQGWPRDYRDATHPLQRAIRDYIAEVTGVDLQAPGVDGCGIPCWLLPISGMASAYARLAVATSGPNGRLGTIGHAMYGSWWFASGTGRIDGRIMSRATEPVIAKVGAAGLLCVALIARGQGVALKVHSGDDESRAVAIAAVLERWAPGVLPPDLAAPEAIVRNLVGQEVGARVVQW